MDKKKPASKAKTKAQPDENPQIFSIVAIGASAGGLDAFTELLRELPVDTGMAFVLIQHLDPKHQSILSQLMGKETKLPVVEVQDGMRIEPNHVYVIPPNANMTVAGRVLRLTPRRDSPGQHMPVDHFMRSLAEDEGDHAIGVILSGSGSDGTLGLLEIQAQGGVTFAQDPQSAKYDGMPRSAIASGCVDFALPPKGIAKELARIGRHPYVIHPKPEEGAELVPETEPGLAKIFAMLRKESGVDFTYYRHTTIRRRIQRRMVVHKIEKLPDYIRHLHNNPAEIKALYQDVLINVTSFFRNPRLFEAVKAEVFPAILTHRKDDAAIRIWVPACSTGEEPYSLAIALLEFLGDRANEISIQIFGTDVSQTAISKARAGRFPENIQADVSSQRLRRFFVRTEGGYIVSKTLRDMCIFAQHNLLSDPPFSQMDVISCRNLLIYLEPVLQKRVLSLLHYALRPHGYLLVGASEGVGTATNLFHLEDRANKIYAKKLVAGRPSLTFAVTRRGEAEQLAASAGRPALDVPEAGVNITDAQKEFDRRLLADYVPAAVFVDENLDVIHTRGSIDRFLKLAPGRATLNLLRLAREGLIYDLRNAVRRARQDDAPVRRENIQLRIDGQVRKINFEVTPVKSSTGNGQYFMVIFENAAPPLPPPKARGTASRAAREELRASNRRLTKMEEELAGTKDYLHSIIENLEATNEELQSANEEVLSSNEELQSTNEELETAKEELQSTNEELNTVNEELRNRNSELYLLNNDLTNLLSSVNIAIIMLASDFSIRRYTPLAGKLLGLIPADIGRSIINIRPSIEMPDLQPTLVHVMDTLNVAEREVRDREGKWYSLRVLPYRTHENKVDGAVITLVDIHAVKTQMEQIKELATQLEMETGRFEAVLEQMPAGVAIAQAPKGQLLLANRQLEQIFGKPFVATPTLERFHEYYQVFHADGRPFQLDEHPMARVLRTGEATAAVEMHIEVQGEKRILQGGAAPVRSKDGQVVGAVMVYSDITNLRKAEQALIGSLELDLRESRRYTLTVIETAREPILILDSNLTVHLANPAFYRTFGLALEETEKKSIYELGQGQWGAPALRMMLEDILRGAERLHNIEIEQDFPKLGKRIMVMNARRIRMARGQQWILLSIQDVTESRRTERLMRERAELLKLAHDAIYVRDMEGAVRFWNRGAEELYGWKAEEAAGKEACDLLKTRFPKSEKEALARVAREGSWEGELVHTTKDGKQITVSSRWALRRDEQGKPSTVLVINRDVTKEREAQAEVVKLSRHLLQSQDEERRRLARELHDTTGQKVAAVSISLDLLEQKGESLPADCRNSVHECRSLVSEISQELRTLAYLLHPPLLDEGGLPSAIRWCVEGLARRIELKVEAEIPPELGRLPEDIEIALFRVVQEALTNVHLHAHARTAKLALKQMDERITLEVSDDGHGFQAAPLHGELENGVGIASMRERIEQLGGQFEIVSGRTGTTVRATVPLKR